MGAVCAKPYVVQIGDKKLTLEQFRRIHTCADALKVAGYTVDVNEPVHIWGPKRRDMVHVNEPFKVRDIMIYKGESIYVATLYGKE
jgi:hypothetical protein